ncbi:hypothetical protein IIC68_01855 [archaeon]|nr:hypothetical protein [archaeon]
MINKIIGLLILTAIIISGCVSDNVTPKDAVQEITPKIPTVKLDSNSTQGEFVTAITQLSKNLENCTPFSFQIEHDPQTNTQFNVIGRPLSSDVCLAEISFTTLGETESDFNRVVFSCKFDSVQQLSSFGDPSLLETKICTITRYLENGQEKPIPKEVLERYS